MLSAGRLAQVQGWFYLLTGLWPLVSGDTFQKITGFKADFWLAQTVGLLLAVSGGVFVLAGRTQRITREIALLAGLEAAVLGGVDLYCVSQPRTTDAYLLDSILEFGFILLWIGIWRLSKKNRGDGARL